MKTNASLQGDKVSDYLTYEGLLRLLYGDT